MSFKAIIAKEPNIAAMTKALADQMQDLGKDIETLIGSPTLTWKPKPKFEREVTVSHGTITTAATTRDDRYLWTNYGTKPHIIRARPGKTLAFASKFKAKTRPGSLLASGGSRGGATVFTQQVQHPGTKPRNFIKKATPLIRKSFKARLKFGMKQAAHASGHSL